VVGKEVVTQSELADRRAFAERQLRRQGTPLPERADQVVPRADAGAVLQQVAGHLSSALLGVEPQVVQACYRPVYDDGLPLLGPAPGVAGAYVATGHSCWGILNAPASGLAMAELIVDGRAQSVDLRAYDPQRA